MVDVVKSFRLRPVLKSLILSLRDHDLQGPITLEIHRKHNTIHLAIAQQYASPFIETIEARKGRLFMLSPPLEKRSEARIPGLVFSSVLRASERAKPNL